MLANPPEVDRRGMPQPDFPGRGQNRQAAPTVGGAASSLDETPAHQPIHQSGQTAGAEADAVGQLVHAEPAVPGEAELDQNVVFGERDVLFFDEVRPESPQQRRLGIEEGAPGPHFSGFERWSHVE